MVNAHEITFVKRARTRIRLTFDNTSLPRQIQRAAVPGAKSRGLVQRLIYLIGQFQQGNTSLPGARSIKFNLAPGGLMLRFAVCPNRLTTPLSTRSTAFWTCIILIQETSRSLSPNTSPPVASAGFLRFVLFTVRVPGTCAGRFMRSWNATSMLSRFGSIRSRPPRGAQHLSGYENRAGVRRFVQLEASVFVILRHSGCARSWVANRSVNGSGSRVD